MITKPTPTQRAVLALLAEQGSARLLSGSRILKAMDLGVDGQPVGVALQMNVVTPYHLKAHGLIERVESNMPGHWWRLTAAGREFASAQRCAEFETEYRDYREDFNRRRRGRSMHY